MNMFTTEEKNKRLSDLGIIIKYMPFLQDHGFSEFGKGQLIGKMELLKEGFSDSTTNHLEQQFESHLGPYKIDSSPDPDGNEQVVNEFGTHVIEMLPHLETLNNKRRNLDGEKNPTSSKVPQRIGVHDTIDENRRKRYPNESNKWNFKNEDESSWITRIRKLADM
jgi:hypothetical protein